MKIDTYFIPPIHHQELALNGDRLFALAHFVLENNHKYINFFRSQKNKWITLDSGVAEGHRVPIHKFMKCAKKIGATEIICPDELYNFKETIKLTKTFLSKLNINQKKKYKFMMVPQANNIKDYVKCLEKLQSLPECSCIGISKFDTPILFGKDTDIHKVSESRKRLIDYLVKHKILTKPIHLLGYDNPNEFKYYCNKNYYFIRSCDSASAILCAIKSIKFKRQIGLIDIKPPGGDIYHNIIMNSSQINLALKNINITKELCIKFYRTREYRQMYYKKNIIEKQAYGRKRYKNNRISIIKKNRVWQSKNIEHHRNIQKSWRARNPNYGVIKHREKYCEELGISINNYNNILLIQKNKCAICKQKESRKRNNKTLNLCLDHNHKNIKVRELLCSRCNKVLGFVDEDINILRNMIKYLQKWNGK